jgi:hypothetical protein
MSKPAMPQFNLCILTMPRVEVTSNDWMSETDSHMKAGFEAILITDSSLPACLSSPAFQ